MVNRALESELESMGLTGIHHLLLGFAKVKNNHYFNTTQGN